MLPEKNCIPSSDKHLFWGWSCLAAVSLVSAILSYWKKIIQARWVFLPIVCHSRQSSADTRSWFQNSFENPQFSSGQTESSFVKNNANVATTSHKTFRQKFKLLVKIWKKIKKKFLGKFRFCQTVPLETYKAVLKNLSKTAPKFLKKSEGIIFCKKLLYFTTRKLLRQTRSFYLKSFQYFWSHLWRNRRGEKMPLRAGRLLWFIRMVISNIFIKWKKILLYRLRFAHILDIYTASCTILTIHSLKCRKICHQNAARGLRLITIDIVRFLKYDRIYRFHLKQFFCRKNSEGGKVAAECVWNGTNS